MLKRTSMLKDADPAICNNCGQCCHPAFKIGEDYHTVRFIACRHLRSEGDSSETRCSVYKKRFTKAPFCMSVAEAIEQGKLPKSCPYVKDDPEYHGTEYTNVEVERALHKQFLAKIDGAPVQLWLGPTGE